MTRSGPTTITRGSDGTRIGLCLSGGGFRAALYGLGAVRYLAEAAVLGQVVAVSAVSGGAVAAAVLADRWPALCAAGYSAEAYVREVEEPFHRALAEHNIRNEALVGWGKRRALPGAGSRGSAMGDALVQRLLKARTVSDLDPGLQVVLTSTDLGAGRAFRVSRDFIGSWDFGYQPVPSHLSLGQVVAASTAVPMLFPPVYLPTAGMGLRDAPPVLSLVDGGVYDNLGIEWFHRWSGSRPLQARPVDFIIVVDGSGSFPPSDRRFKAVRAVLRSRDVQYVQTRATRTRWFVEDLLAGKLHGLYLAANRDAGQSPQSAGGSALFPSALPPGFGEKLAGLRTDLDRFQLYESELLSYHGYWSAHARMTEYAKALALAGDPEWQQFGDLSADDRKRLTDALDAGRKHRPRLMRGR